MQFLHKASHNVSCKVNEALLIIQVVPFIFNIYLLSICANDLAEDLLIAFATIQEVIFCLCTTQNHNQYLIYFSIDFLIKWSVFL